MNLINLNELGNPKHVANKTSVVMKKMRLIKDKIPNKRNLIDNMTESNTRLKKQVRDMRSKGNCKKELAQINVIENLVKEMDSIDYQLKTEREYLSNIQNQIQQMYTQFEESFRHRNNIKKKCLLDVPQEKISSHKDALQEKLHVAKIQLGIEQTKNTALREKIQRLMSDRKIFNKEYDSLLEKLKKGKQVLVDLKSVLQNSVNYRQNVHQKLDQMNIKENKLYTVQAEEVDELVQNKDQENKMKLFFETKLKARRQSKLSEERGRNRISDNRDIEKKLHECMTLKNNISDSIEIKFDESRGSADCTAIVKRLKQEDSDIESLFIHLSQQNLELEALKEKVFQQETEIEERMAIQIENEDRQNEQYHRLNKSKNNQIETKIALYDELETSKRNLNKLFMGIQQCTEISNTDVSSLLKLLGENNTTHEFNYKLFLQALETRIISLTERIVSENKSLKTRTAVWYRIAPPQEDYLVPTGTGTTVILTKKINITTPCPICYLPVRNLNDLLK